MAPSDTSNGHQRLLDFEEAISEASCATHSVASKSGAGTSRPPTRPSSARPASATSDGAKARRPASARGGRPPSSAGSTASGYSTASSVRSMASTRSSGSAQSSASFRTAAERGGQDRSQEFAALCDLIGWKAAQRFRSVQQCFCHLDQDHDAAVTRAEMREFCHVLNIAKEHADRFFDILDINHNGVIDFLEVAAILGPYIQPGYQAPNNYSSAAVHREEPPRQERAREPDLAQLVEAIGSKASQKYRTVTDCFCFFDDDKSGLITRSNCQRFVQCLGFAPGVGERVYQLLCNGHHEAGFLAFAEAFGPYIQPGYQAPVLRRPRTSGGSTPRSATPPPSQVVVERQAAVVRQRPQSARLHGRGGRSRAAADVRAAAEWQRKGGRGCGSSGSCSSETFEERPVPGYTPDPDKRPCRAEVTDRHLGSYMYLPETPRAVHNLTWDSSQVKKRLGVYPESTAGSGRSVPRPPSAPRPHQAARRAQRPRPRGAEAGDDSYCGDGSSYETASAFSGSELPRYTPARGHYHKDYAGTVIKSEPLPAARQGPLETSLEQRWSVL